MKTGAWAVGAAAFLVAGAFLWLPLGATAQSLVDQSAAVGVMGDLQSRAGVNGVGALNRAKRTLAGAQAQTAPEERKTWQVPQTPDAGRRAPAAMAAAPKETLPAWDVVPAQLLAKSELRKQAKGRIVLMAGTIEGVENFEGRLAYRIIPAPAMELKPGDRFVVEVPQGEASMGRAGELTRAFGSFSAETISRRGVRVFIFRNGQIVSRIAPGPTAPAAAGAQAAPPAAQSFSDPLGGWKLEGTAQSEDGGTAVLVSPAGRPYFLSRGESFGNGYKVASVGTGEVKLEKDGATVTIAAW